MHGLIPSISHVYSEMHAEYLQRTHRLVYHGISVLSSRSFDSELFMAALYILFLPQIRHLRIPHKTVDSLPTWNGLWAILHIAVKRMSEVVVIYGRVSGI